MTASKPKPAADRQKPGPKPKPAAGPVAGGPVAPGGGDGGFTEFNDGAQNFNASIGEVMGSWMSALTKADVDRQVAWTRLLQELFTPDKSGTVPTVNMISKLAFGGASPPSTLDLGAGGTTPTDSSVGISFPVGLAVMGEQFAADTASLAMDMRVSSSALDTSSLSGSASGSGEAKIGWGPFSAKISISASMSTSSERKRQSDYSSTTHAELTMKRVPTPEPVQVALEAWTDLVRVQGEIAKAQMLGAAQKAAEADKLLPAGTTT